MANVRYADRIYVLRHGKLVGAGTHAELIAAMADTPSHAPDRWLPRRTGDNSARP